MKQASGSHPPGGSVKDQDSIDYCNKTDMAMLITGYRHFQTLIKTIAPKSLKGT